MHNRLFTGRSFLQITQLMDLARNLVVAIAVVGVNKLLNRNTLEVVIDPVFRSVLPDGLSIRV